MFDFNPNEVAIGFPLFKKGDYVFSISEPKSYRDERDEKVYEGIRYMLTCTQDLEGNGMVGKKYSANFDLSQEYGQQNAMKFLLAATGFPATDDGQKAFREKFGALSYKCNPAEKTAGEGWHIAKQQEVKATLDTEIAKKGTKIGEEVQKFPVWLPAK